MISGQIGKKWHGYHMKKINTRRCKHNVSGSIAKNKPDDKNMVNKVIQKVRANLGDCLTRARYKNY